MSRPTAESILEKVAQRQQMIKLAADEVNLPAMLAGGTGAGAAGGLFMSALKDLPSIRQMTQIQGQLPHLQAQRANLQNYLQGIRSSSQVPLEKITDRRLAKTLLQNPSSPQQYYFVRRGLEEGYQGTSRATKILNVLKNRVKANALKRSLLGAGLGAGAGLLASTAQGYFDTP